MTATRCPRCEAPLVEISLKLGGQNLEMKSCSACDRRWWHRGDELVDFAGLVPQSRRRA